MFAPPGPVPTPSELAHTIAADALPLPRDALAAASAFCASHASTLIFTQPPSSAVLSLDRSARSTAAHPQLQQLLASSSAPPVCSPADKELLTAAALSCVAAAGAGVRRATSADTLTTLDPAIVDSGRVAANVLRLLARETTGSSALYVDAAGVGLLARCARAAADALVVVVPPNSSRAFSAESILSRADQASVTGSNVNVTTSSAPHSKATSASVGDKLTSALLSFQLETLKILVNVVKLEPARGRDAVHAGVLRAVESALRHPPLLHSSVKNLRNTTTETSFVAARILFMIVGTTPSLKPEASMTSLTRQTYAEYLLDALAGRPTLPNGSFASRVTVQDDTNQLSDQDRVEPGREGFTEHCAVVLTDALGPFVNEFLTTLTNGDEASAGIKAVALLQPLFGLKYCNTVWPLDFSTNSCISVINDLLMAMFAIINLANANIGNDADKTEFFTPFEFPLLLVASILVKAPLSTVQTLEPPFMNCIHILMNTPFSSLPKDTIQSVFTPSNPAVFDKALAGLPSKRSQSPVSISVSMDLVNRLLNILETAVDLIKILSETDSKGNMKYASTLDLMDLAHVRNSKVCQANHVTQTPQPKEFGTSSGVDGQLAPLLVLLQALCRQSPAIFAHVKLSVLPEDLKRGKALDTTDSLTGHCVRLLGDAVLMQNSKQCMGNLLLTLFDGDAVKMARYCGYGNCVGYFMAANIKVDNLQEMLNNEDGKSTVNPITGGEKDDTEREKLKAEWDALTDEQKEHEAERLFILFDKLNKTGIAKVEFKNPPP